MTRTARTKTFDVVVFGSQRLSADPISGTRFISDMESDDSSWTQLTRYTLDLLVSFFLKFVNGKRRRTGSRQQNDRALRNPFYPNRFPPFFKAEKEKSIVAKKVDAPAHTCGALKRKVDLLLARPNEIFWGEMRAFISASKRLANKL